MATTDFTVISGSNADVLTGPTLEITPVSEEAGDFSWGFHSNDAVGSGAVAVAYTRSPVTFPSGSSWSSLLTKVSALGEGHSVFIFTSMGDGTGSGDINQSAYMLGIQADDSNKIILCKGPLLSGCPGGESGTTVSGVRIIAKSTLGVDPNTWVHLRLSARVQAGGDVVLTPEINNESLANPAIWETIPGMEEFYVDGVLELMGAGPPLVAGRPGFGFSFSETYKGAGVGYARGGKQ